MTCLHSALLLAGLMALLVRAMIPAGYMPEGRGAGWLMTLCTGDGVQAVLVDADGTPVEPDGPADTAPSCAFGSLAAPALSAAPALLLVLAIAFVMARGLVPARRPVRRLPEQLRPPLRAPPVSG